MHQKHRRTASYLFRAVYKESVGQVRQPLEGTTPLSGNMKLLLLTVLLASAAVFAAGANDFKLKANEYFQELTDEITTDLNENANGKLHLVHNYSIVIGGSPFTLGLNNGTIKKLSNISHSGAGDLVYTIPAVGALYTIGDAVLQFKFDLASNLSSVNSSAGEVTLELSGVGISVAVAAHENAAGNYSAHVIKDKLAVLGNLESIELSDSTTKNMKDFVELCYKRHASSMSTAIHREFSHFLHQRVRKVDVGKYVQS